MLGRLGKKGAIWAGVVVVFVLGLCVSFFWDRETPESDRGDVASAPVVAPDTLPDRVGVDAPMSGETDVFEEPVSVETEVAIDALAESLRRLSETPGVVPGELLLQFQNPQDIGALRGRAGSLGIRVLWSDARLSSARISFSDADLLARELRDNGAITDAGPNFVMRIPGLPEEPVLGTDSANAGGTEPFEDRLLASLGANVDRSGWGEGVTVAILDSGISGHPSLENVAITRIDLSNIDAIHGHGTAMASLVAGQLAPAEGIAPAAGLIDLRITDENGASNTGLVAEAILSAADRRADVINLSLGTYGDSAVLRAAIDYAVERNIVVVAAAGNEQADRLAFPAGYSGVVSVGAVDATNTQAYFSNSGESLTISAPGVGIFSAHDRKRLVIGSGTSQAAAITSGVVAALLSQGVRPSEIVHVLEQNAFQTGAPREQVGAGVIRMR